MSCDESNAYTGCVNVMGGEHQQLLQFKYYSLNLIFSIKVESILRITSQILDEDNLKTWNEVCERDLH